MVLLDCAACRSRALWSWSKERGLATLHPLGACPPPQKLYLILRPCPLFPLATRVLAFMPIKKVYRYSLLCDGTPIALFLPKKSTEHRQSLHQVTYSTIVCRPSGPSYTHAVPRIIRCQSSHLHHAVPFSVTISCTTVLSNDSRRRDPRAVKPSCIFQQPSCMDDAYAMRGNHASVGELINISCRF